MRLTIDDDSMSSDSTRHTARRARGERSQWEVSWLPGRTMDRNSAITAMTLAEISDLPECAPGGKSAIFFEGWAAELGLKTEDVRARLAEPPAWAEAGKQAEPPEPEAAG
jgi:hypothetical protein